MGGGRPQATRIPENPVGTSGIPAEGGAPGREGRRGRRVGGLLLPPLGLMALVWFLSAQPDLSSGLQQDFLLRKGAHVAEFAVLTLLWARALAGIRPSGPPNRTVPWAAAAIGLAWAAVDERHQHHVEGRVGTVRDVAIDAAGVVLALALLRWAPLGRRLGLPRASRARRR